MLDYENSANPDPDTRHLISLWKPFSTGFVSSSEPITQMAKISHDMGLGVKDSLHVACAVSGQVVYLITVDKGILRKRSLISTVKSISPIEFLSEEDIHAN